MGEGEGEVQIQDYGGNWRTVSNVVNNLQRIGFELRSVKSRIRTGGSGPLIKADD
jgi:hypothetical protein